MKRLSLLFTLFFIGHAAFGQNPVTWKTDYKQVQGDVFELILTGTIEKGWYVYSLHQDNDDGPIPASFIMDATNYTAADKATEEGHMLNVSDPIFGMVVHKYKESVVFKQKIKVKDYSKPVSIDFEYQSCNDQTCIKPVKTFTFQIIDPKSKGAVTPANGGQSTPGKPADNNTPSNTTASDGNPTAPTAVPAPEVKITVDSGVEKINGVKVFRAARPSIKLEAPVNNCGVSESQGLFWKFAEGMGWGFVALLTPCVFPMIPLTVGFFTKRSKNRATGIRNALIYSFSIIFLFVGLGLSVTALFGTHALNDMATHWLFNTFLFALLFVFAFSFFGYFEIALPSSWANKTNTMAGKGGVLGIFFMAATLVIVSFSCTGPLVGTALVRSVTEPLGPAVVMFGFSLALALPFGLFAFFPGLLQSVPRSGSWMDAVKVTIGFLEIAFAFKFFSVADMTQHWGVLKYEVFVGVWILCAVLLALYYFKVIKFPHDAPGRKIAPGRAVLGLLILGLAGYLGTGYITDTEHCSYRSLSLLSGQSPPGRSPYTIKQFCKADCPLALPCFHDYDEGVAYAKANKKMIMIDFTGYGCVNCRKMENNVWPLDRIYHYLRDDLILISLYVDDRKVLPEPMVSPDGHKLRNYGDKWAALEKENFQQETQPLYCLLSPDEILLTPPRGYTPDAKEYENFLLCGFDALAKVCPDCHQPAKVK